MRLTACVSVPICVGLALVADDFVFIALSSKWTAIVPILQILCATSLVKSIDVLIVPVLRARYRTNFLTVYNLVLIVLMPIAFIGGAMLAGGVGVALAWLIPYPIVMARMALEAFREIDLSWKFALAQLRIPVLAAAVMMLVVIGLRLAIVGEDWPVTLLRLTLSCVVGALVYVGILWKWGGSLRDEVREVISWLLKLRHARQSHRDPVQDAPAP
jgi:PST family polysaccharide transporter